MKYKAEIVVDGKMVKHVMMDASNPNTVIRAIVNSYPFSVSTIFILNEVGENWVNVVKRVGGVSTAKAVRKNYYSFSPSEIDLVFSGAMKISEGTHL